MSISNQAQEITLARSILTSPAQVYAAFTRAAGWCKWCCKSAEADARVGEKLHIYTEGYNAYGEFTQLEQDKIVSFTFNGDAEPPTRIVVGLTRREPYTDVTFTVTVQAPEADWPGFAEFLERTWGRALDNLKVVRLTVELHRKAYIQARLADKSLNGWVKDVIESAVQE